jgi:hypothetical protein
MNVHDISDCRRMMAGFGNYLSNKLNGRSRLERPKATGIPMIAIPEHLSRSGQPTHPHYHAILMFPVDQNDEWRRDSSQFWRKVAIRHTIAIDLEFKDCYDPVGALGYAMKNSDAHFTVQSLITSGRLH